MAITLPLPVRVAAGVLATGLDRLRHLPGDLPTLPVTVAGQAMRASLRVQQEITELAGRGDELLAGITSRPTEHPTWARFDDEDDAAGAGRVDGNSTADGNSTVDGNATVQGGVGAAGAGGVDDTSTADGVDDTSTADDVDDTSTADGEVGDPTGPADMPGYDDLRLAQVRARIRGLDAAAVARLLEYEQHGASRAGYLTLLSNRLTTLRSSTPQDPST